jgi:cytidine deaminase
MDSKTATHLIEAARTALAFSYSPYSRYPVGAAVLIEGGKIFTGTNIENSSYSLTLCAERVAVSKAVSQGHHRIQAVAVVCAAGNECMPCGACRQVIFEFSLDAKIVIEVRNGEPKVISINELLPLPFSAKDLGKTF